MSRQNLASLSRTSKRTGSVVAQFAVTGLFQILVDGPAELAYSLGPNGSSLGYAEPGIAPIVPRQ